MAKKKNDEDENLVSVAQYAAHRGVSSSRIGEMKRTGRLVLVHGKIDKAASDEALDGPSSVPDWDGDEVPIDADRGEAERIKTIWAARKVRAEVLAATGELVPAEEVRREAFQVARVARDKILAVPLRVADRVLAMDDKAEVVALLEEELRGALTEVVRSLEADEG
jgi:hypothetical protein